MKNIYTPSSLIGYESCPRKYYYRDVKMIDTSKHPFFVKPSDNIPMLIGSIIHQCLEEYHNNRDYHIIISKIEDNNMRIKIEAMMDGYSRREVFGGLPKLNFVKTEQQLGCRIIHDDVADFCLMGKIDGVVEYNNKLWVLDHKTSSRELKSADTYLMHRQTNLYCWMMQQHGLNTEGVIINFLKVPMLQQRTKKRIETDEEFKQRVDDDTLNRETMYYQRLEIPRENGEVKYALKDAIDCIRHIQFSEKNKDWRRNDNACNEYNSSCIFKSLCLDTLDERDCKTKTVKHEELDIDTINIVNIDLSKKFQQLF